MKRFRELICLSVMAIGLSACIPAGRTRVKPTVATPSAAESVPAPSRDEDPASSGIAVASSPSAPARPAVVPDAVAVEDGTYVVKAGDTLRSIGNRTGAGSEAIALANRMVVPFVVKVGQKLRIPGGRYHLVKPGEAGFAIARAYGTDWSTLVRLNQLAEPYVLRIGQRLKLPSGDGIPSDPASVAVSRARAFSVNIDELFAGAAPAGGSPDQEPAIVADSSASAVRPAMLPPRISGFVWPVSGGKIARRFGPYGEGRVNQGIDIAAPEGTEIRAAADGVVVYASMEVALFDGLILLRHAEGWTSAYGYAANLRVREGQAVRKGDVIAIVGPGPDQGPQLHFELRRRRVPVDPASHLGS